MTKAQMLAKLAMYEAANTPLSAEPISPIPASTAPSWLTDARAAIPATPKPVVVKKASVAPHHIVRSTSFTGSKGELVKGYAVVKMFGAEPDKRRPNGKFLTAAEITAIVEFAHAPR